MVIKYEKEEEQNIFRITHSDHISMATEETPSSDEGGALEDGLGLGPLLI